MDMIGNKGLILAERVGFEPNSNARSALLDAEDHPTRQRPSG
jgi:hypothetical protein